MCLTPQLLSPKRITIRTYNDIDHTRVMKLLRARSQKKYGFLEVAYAVEEVGKDRYNVRMEYTVKD